MCSWDKLGTRYKKTKQRKKTQLPLLMGFPDSSVGKGSPCNVGDLGSIPWLGRSPGEGKGYPLQYSGLENSMGYIVQGVAKNWTRLSDFHSLPHSHFWRLRSKKGCWGTKAVYCTYPQHTPPPKGKANHPSTPAQPLDSPISSLHIRNQLAHLRSKQGDLPVTSFRFSCYSKSPNKNLDRISWLTSYQFLLTGKGQVSWSVSVK